MKKHLSRRVLSVILTLTLLFGLCSFNVSSEESGSPSLSEYRLELLSLIRESKRDDYVASIVIDTEAGTMRIDNGEEQELSTQVCLDYQSDPLVPILDILEAQGQEASYDEDTDILTVDDGFDEKSLLLSEERQKSRELHMAEEHFAKSAVSLDPGSDVLDDIPEMPHGSTEGEAFYKLDALRLPLIDEETAEDLFFIDVNIEGSRMTITKPYQTCRIIVQTGGDELNNTYGATREISDGNGEYVLQYESEAATRSAYEALRAYPFFKSVALDRVVCAATDDVENVEIIEEPESENEPAAQAASLDTPALEDRSGAYRIGSDEYLNYLQTVPGSDHEIVVAVIDTGVDYTHPFLAGRVLNKGFNTSGEGSETDYMDGHGHGTHVSGIIADNTPSNVKILPIKVLDEDGRGTDLAVCLGMQIAAENNVDVINMSLGGYRPPDEESLYEPTVAEYIAPKNIIMAVAAGNDFDDTQNYVPARIPYCITVASTVPQDDSISWFSNYGDAVDIAAPGDGILSCVTGGGYESWSGTSMASPFAAAAAALLKLKDNSINGSNIHEAIKGVTVDCGLAGRDNRYGEGTLDFRKTLGLLNAKSSFGLSGNIYSKIEIDLAPGLTLSYRPEPVIYPLLAVDKSYTVTNSNPEVASFDGQYISGLKVGESTIVFSLSNGSPDNTLTYEVTVARSETWLDHAAESYAGGYGTKWFPYLIETAEQLAKLSRDETDTETYFVQIADIDLSDHEWVPIGKTYGPIYPTHYDGNGYEIKGLHINRPNHIMLGLFETSYRNTLQNIRLTDVDIIGYDFVAGIVGFGSNTTIKNCSVSGKIKGEYPPSAIAGDAMVLENCFSDAELISQGNSFGGLAYSVGTIRNSIFAGKLILADGTNGSLSSFGGLVGSMTDLDIFGDPIYREMTNCVSVSTVADFITDGASISNIYYNKDAYLPISSPDAENPLDLRPYPVSDFYTKAFFGDAGNWDIDSPWDFENVWQQNEGELPKLRNDHKEIIFPKILESIHPVGPNMDESQTYTYPGEADRLRITFSPDSFVEDGYFYIYFEDGEYRSISGDAIANRSFWMEGNSFTIRLATGGNGGGYGYKIIDLESLTYSNTFSYKIIDHEITITGYDGNPEILEIPETIDGYPVTAIGNSSFSGYSRLEKVILPDSVKSIGDRAFSWCFKLTDITLGSGLKEIGNSSFYTCGFSEFFIPASVETIGAAALSCNTLKKITVDPQNAFYCDIDGVLFNKDKDVIFAYPAGRVGGYTIPQGVKTIGAGTFSDCWSLNEIIIPEGVTSIKSGAFESCSNLFSVILPNTLLNIEDSAFAYCRSLSSVTFGSDTEVIGASAFIYCDSLSEITLPDKLVKISSGAFSYCETLNALTIPEGVRVVETEAFAYNPNLSNVYFEGDAPTTWGKNVFKESPSVTINYLEGKAGWTTPTWNGCPAYPYDPSAYPESPHPYRNKMNRYWTYIHPDSSATWIAVTFDEQTYTEEWNDYIYITDLAGNPIFGSPFDGDTLAGQTVYVPGNGFKIRFTTNGGDVGYGFKVTDVKTSDPPEYPGGKCGDNLNWELNLANGTLVISGTGGMWDFEVNTCPWADCWDYIKGVMIGSGVTSIGGSAFAESNGLTSITISDSVANIASDAFVLCRGLKDIIVSENSLYYSTLNGVLFNKNKTTLVFCPMTKEGEYTIPDGVKIIGENAFHSCDRLTSIAIPEGVLSINDRAFIWCDQLTDVAIPDSVTSIGVNAFWNCMNLTNVTIGSGVESISDGAFAYCYKLEGITVSAANLDFSSQEGVLFDKSKTTLIQYSISRKGEYVIPNGVKSIIRYAFRGSSNLTSITIPESVTNIVWGAFSQCPRLTIYCYPNTFAELFAIESELPYKYINRVIGKIATCNTASPAVITLLSADRFYTISVEGTQDFAFTDVLSGTYTLTVVKPGCVPFTVNNIVVGNTDVDLTKDSRPEVRLITPVAGDINNDDVVTMDDLLILLSSNNYNKPTSAAKDSLCDINGDGVVTMDDLLILLSSNNYNKGAVVVN